ncbi:MAG: NAD(P)H-hydrate dehydratase [Mogibacterium sp.]|nr:NAD(P)H-hydrate dehydratase [Mogibacterium sp.]
MKTDRKYITEEDARTVFPVRPADCNKGDFGYVALIGGSIEYSGAIRLAAMANAAMRSGAGVASIAAPRSICPVIANSILEATLIPLSDSSGRMIFAEDEFAAICGRYDCIAFGMGIANTPETAKAVEFLLQHYDRTLIIDADGLNAMAGLDRGIIRNSKARLVLTPHVKEFSRLSGLGVAEIKADPAKAAAPLADELEATVLLKGSTTVVTEPERSLSKSRRVFFTDRGCPGMATAGSGDVLSGILSAICVNAEDLTLAAAAGAYINGAAGELAQSRHSAVTMTAADTASAVAETIEGLLSKGGK